MAGEELHSYRCPVCGHADEILLRPGEALSVPCTHCETLLELSLEMKSSERVSVILKRPKD